ncbi:MAG: YdcF family protein [Leptolyngbyaceae cyanobacterium bins.302]|nr:YdcF family protein [Leptolyngbyaceae cyanobacterium bins.302]
MTRHLTKRKNRFAKLGIFLGTIALIPSAWIGYREIKSLVDQPKAILVLGGDPEREDFAAAFARQHPDLPVWISSGSNQEYTEGVFSDAGIDFTRLHIDRTAEDTVTNFTTLADKLRSQGISSVYLITSDYHMRRARIIGEIVFGSRDISLKPVPVPSEKSSEPLLKSVRDGARAILWITTGHTGSTLNQSFGKQ